MITKSFVLMFVFMTLGSLAMAGEHVFASATLKTKDGSVSTPPVDLYRGGQTIGRARVRIDGADYLFALKSSGYEKDGQLHYSFALSLSKTGKDEFVVSKSGKMDSLKPVEFSFEKDGVLYAAVVNLVP